MTQIQAFNFKGAAVRTVTGTDGEPRFVAKDVAEVLGYRNAPDMTRNLDSDEAATHNLRIRSKDGNAQNRQVTIINESGLYTAILHSRKPEAKQFKRWVTGTVLPAIRKTGGYVMGEEHMETDEELALQTIEMLRNKVEQQAKKMEQQRAKLEENLSVDSYRAFHKRNNWSQSFKIKMGKKATEICTSNGNEISTQYTEMKNTHGKIINAKTNLYPIEVLDFAYDELIEKGASPL